MIFELSEVFGKEYNMWLLILFYLWNYLEECFLYLFYLKIYIEIVILKVGMCYKKF